MCGTCLNTRRHLTCCDPFVAKIAFLNHAPHSRREFGRDLLDKRARIAPVKTAGSIRTGSHAISAADTAVPIHHDDPIRFSFPGRSGRTDADTRRIIAMIAQQQRWPAALRIGLEFVDLFRKRVLERVLPDPFHLLLAVSEIRDVVGPMAGGYAQGTIIL